ncbi:MAG: hypothetical protein HQK84_05295, partial [Nitrospinae bacterium]|nr:hypothetical protein [Nitrospinota bacterium]
IIGYGAHLVRNGLGSVVTKMMEKEWVTHLMTNGAGTIHDFEFALMGKSTEDVRENIANGTFGIWEETGKYIHLALLVGALEGRGYGESLGKVVCEEKLTLPTIEELKEQISRKMETGENNLAAYSELLETMQKHSLASGEISLSFPWKKHSLLANAFRLGIPLTVHPGIGYDIINTHPLYNGAVIGRGGGTDFKVFCKSMENLSEGVFCSIGSAIMSPQVFEKAMSVVNNIGLQRGKKTEGHYILVNDLQEGTWDWSKGEPPKDNPAYYLRYCKSFARMGGEMDYVCGNNRDIISGIYQQLISGQ